MTESKPHKPTKVQDQNGEWRDTSGKSVFIIAYLFKDAKRLPSV